MDPEVLAYDLTEHDQFFILASDGLWDVFSNDEAVVFIHERLRGGKTLEQVSREIVEEAYRRGSSDNITALLVLLYLQPERVISERHAEL